MKMLYDYVYKPSMWQCGECQRVVFISMSRSYVHLHRWSTKIDCRQNLATWSLGCIPPIQKI